MTLPTLTPPPAAPDLNVPTTFQSLAAAFVAWFSTHVTEMNNWTTLGNALSGVTSTFQFLDGAAATPAFTFAADTDTGIWRPGNNLFAVSTNGLEALRVNATQNLLIGNTATVTGLGAMRVDVQGITTPTATIGATVNNASVNGPTFIGAKSRSATLGGYTIVQAADFPMIFEAYGADGSAMVLSARMRAVVEGVPAAGDVRAGWRMFTGNGAGTVAEALRADILQNIYFPAATAKLFIGGTAAGNQVLTGRITGWVAATNTVSRATFDTTTVTTAQLAQRVKALIDDLMTHGAIGT